MFIDNHSSEQTKRFVGCRRAIRVGLYARRRRIRIYIAEGFRRCAGVQLATWGFRLIWSSVSGLTVVVQGPALLALNRPFWRIQSAEALCRAPIDHLLNERLGRLQENCEAYTNLAVLGEKPMTTKVPGKEPEEYISGDIDYVVGYSGGNKRFESALIVIEAKRGQSFSSGSAQCVAYLGILVRSFYVPKKQIKANTAIVGLQQHRERLRSSRMSTKVYGIVSDGLVWEFLRLDGNRLSISSKHKRATPADFFKT
jgi:hypothetical protein